MLDREEAVRVIEGVGADVDAEAVARRAQAAWRLVPTRGDGPAVVTVGGPAPLADGEAWPVNDAGVPLTFVAAIDPALVTGDTGGWPVAAWGHDGGLVRIFGDLVDDPYESAPALVLPAPPGATLTATEPPPLPDPFPDDGPQEAIAPEERCRRLPLARYDVAPMLTVPEADPEDEDRDDELLEIAYAVRRATVDDPRDPWELSHLLGYACSPQGDVRTIGTYLFPDAGGADDWQVLLALHPDPSATSEPAEHEGPGLAYTLIVPAGELATGAYDRAVLVVEES
ncbi:MAG: hypothetical protein M0P31_19090 [Solirubrobacteraceae bacterium]|nr:hypothetical protein [Solirubrobacteraceae bacterium]